MSEFALLFCKLTEGRLTVDLLRLRNLLHHTKWSDDGVMLSHLDDLTVHDELRTEKIVSRR